MHIDVPDDGTLQVRWDWVGKTLAGIVVGASVSLMATTWFRAADASERLAKVEAAQMDLSKIVNHLQSEHLQYVSRDSIAEVNEKLKEIKESVKRLEDELVFKANPDNRRR